MLELDFSARPPVPDVLLLAQRQRARVAKPRTTVRHHAKHNLHLFLSETPWLWEGAAKLPLPTATTFPPPLTALAPLHTH